VRGLGQVLLVWISRAEVVEVHDRFNTPRSDAGTHLLTGEEVGIKLVSGVAQPWQHA
jgi:hypothetical protein